MTYPPDVLPVDKTDATVAAEDHAPLHNDTSQAVNDIVAKLGPTPAGPFATLTSRLADTDDRLDTAETQLSSTITLGPPPWITALEGGSFEVPENTLEGFRATVAAGNCDILRLDAQVTADGALVVSFDATLDRVTTKAGAIASYTAAQLVTAQVDPVNFFRCDGYPNLRLPLVDDVLRELGGKVVLEILARSVAAIVPLCALVNRRGLTGAVHVATNDPTQIVGIAAAGCKPVLHQGTAAMTAGTNHAAAIAAGAVQLVTAKECTDAQITAAVAAGYPYGVKCYSVDTRYDRARLYALGVQGVDTHVPAYLRDRTPATVDSFDTGGWGPGMVPAFGAVNPKLRPGGILEISDVASTSATISLGELSPVPAAFTLNGEARHTAAFTSGSTAFYLHLAEDDRPYDGSLPPIRRGYAIRFTIAGEVRVERNTVGTSTVLATSSVPLTAHPVGTWWPFRVTVTPTTIDGRIVTPVKFATVTDATFRMSWFLSLSSRLHTGGVWQFRNLTRT